MKIDFIKNGVGNEPHPIEINTETRNVKVRGNSHSYIYLGEVNICTRNADIQLLVLHNTRKSTLIYLDEMDKLQVEIYTNKGLREQIRRLATYYQTDQRTNRFIIKFGTNARELNDYIASEGFYWTVTTERTTATHLIVDFYVNSYTSRVGYSKQLRTIGLTGKKYAKIDALRQLLDGVFHINYRYYTNLNTNKTYGGYEIQIGRVYYINELVPRGTFQYQRNVSGNVYDTEVLVGDADGLIEVNRIPSSTGYSTEISHIRKNGEIDGILMDISQMENKPDYLMSKRYLII